MTSLPSFGAGSSPGQPARHGAAPVAYVPPVPLSAYPGGGTGPQTPAQVHPNPRCTCSHGIAVHDIRGNGTRGACCVISGPRGVRCGCKGYEAAP